MYIDTHAHLFDKQYELDLDEVILRAKQNKVDEIIIPATDISTTEQAIKIAEKYEGVFVACGVHPHETKAWDSSIIMELENLAKHPKVIAIGEIGLDYHYDFSPKEIQIKAFQEQLELALTLDLPVIVHNRESDADMKEIITKYSALGLKAQFHCFNGSLEDAQYYISLNHIVSFTGNITFKKFDFLRDIAKQIPLNKIMIETDSPYMSPIPHRGKRNEPAYLSLVAETLAQLHSVSVEEIAEITSANAREFFSLRNINKPILVYPLGEALYINVTNRCNADCVFCSRKGDAVINGFSLRMNKSQELPALDYIKEIGDPKKYSEVVFCGYGEPTIRWSVVKEIAEYVKANGGKTRLNTNGHGNVINKFDITEEFNGRIDVVSISLNSTDKEQYSKLMKLPEAYFEEMINFVKVAKMKNVEVVLSVVDYPEINIKLAERFARNVLGVSFRLRSYF